MPRKFQLKGGGEIDFGREVDQETAQRYVNENWDKGDNIRAGLLRDVQQKYSKQLAADAVSADIDTGGMFFDEELGTPYVPAAPGQANINLAPATGFGEQLQRQGQRFSRSFFRNLGGLPYD